MLLLMSKQQQKQTFSLREWLTIACEVWGCDILDGDLLQEGRLLAARVPTDHPGLLQPLTEPGQMTITHVRVGQEVTAKVNRDRQREREREREGNRWNKVRTGQKKQTVLEAAWMCCYTIIVMWQHYELIMAKWCTFAKSKCFPWILPSSIKNLMR